MFDRDKHGRDSLAGSGGCAVQRSARPPGAPYPQGADCAPAGDRHTFELPAQT